MTTLSSLLAWRIPWTEKPGGLWSMGSQRADMTESNLAQQHTGFAKHVNMYLCKHIYFQPSTRWDHFH